MKNLMILFALLPALSLFHTTKKLSTQEIDSKASMLNEKVELEDDFLKPVFELNFSQYTLKINDYVAFESMEEGVASDTIFLIEESGSPKRMLESCLMEISSPLAAKISIEQAYQTTLVINDEGPSTRLENWIHYTSDWEILEEEAGQFKTLVYSNEARAKFPEVALDSFKNYVKETKGVRWYDVIKENTLVAENGSYPAFVDISHYYFRIRIQPQNAGLIEQIVCVKVQQN